MVQLDKLSQISPSAFSRPHSFPWIETQHTIRSFVITYGNHELHPAMLVLRLCSLHAQVHFHNPRPLMNNPQNA